MGHQGATRKLTNTTLLDTPALRVLAAIALLAALITGSSAFQIQPASAAEDSPTQIPPPLPSQTFAAPYALVFEKLLVSIKSLELSVAKKDKDGGKITTTTYRYFKIFSAAFPPVQEDYRDTYEIQLEKAPDKQTVVTIKRKFEYYDRSMPPMGGWAVREPDATGVSVGDIFSTLDLELAAAALSTAQ